MLAVLVQSVACVQEPDTCRAHLRLALAADADGVWILECLAAGV